MELQYIKKLEDLEKLATAQLEIIEKRNDLSDKDKKEIYNTLIPETTCVFIGYATYPDDSKVEEIYNKLVNRMSKYLENKEDKVLRDRHNMLKSFRPVKTRKKLPQTEF